MPNTSANDAIGPFAAGTLRPHAPPIYEPFSAEVRDDPFPLYRRLRDEAPVFRHPTLGFWALSRYQDVLEAARDWSTFSHSQGVDFDGTTEVVGPGDFLDTDPPRHDELRDLVRHRFAPREGAKLEAVLREKVVELLQPWVEGGAADLARDVCWPLPVRLISSILGFPPEDQQHLTSLAQRVLIRQPDDGSIPGSARSAYGELRHYFAGVAAERRRRPATDLLSDIVHGTVHGERLTDEEVVGMCTLLFIGGTETTATLLATAFVLFSEHPDHWAKMRTTPDLIPAAIEEVLRFDPPFHKFSRVTARPVTVHGHTIPKESRVVLIYGSANRDERRFPAPDMFDPHREPKRHLAFGNGIHFCLGAPLARLEARIVFEEALRRVRAYELTDDPVRLPTHVTRGFVSVPVRTQQET